MAVMAKKKPAEVRPDPEPPPVKASKKPRAAVFITMDDETESQLLAYIAAQDVEPTSAAVGLKALREFLVSRGFRKPDPK